LKRELGALHTSLDAAEGDVHALIDVLLNPFVDHGLHLSDV